MKLAEALILRGDLQNKLSNLEDRLSSNVMIQEGDKVSEDPMKLLEDYNSILNDLEILIRRINRTNNEEDFNQEMKISDALVKRDILMKKRNVLMNMASESSLRQDRYSRSEVRYVATVDVVGLQKKIDSISKEYRELDTRIQGLNWLVDLI